MKYTQHLTLNLHTITKIKCAHKIGIIHDTHDGTKISEIHHKHDKIKQLITSNSHHAYTKLSKTNESQANTTQIG